MSTSFSGTQISSTYAGILKTGDNAVVSGSLRVISDGLGNDTALQVSTAGVKSTGTMEVAGALTQTGAATLASTLSVAAATTLAAVSASGAVTGAGFTALLASPPSIGGTAPAAGSFTTLAAASVAATGAVSGATGAFSGAVSGASFTGAIVGSTGSFSGALTPAALVDISGASAGQVKFPASQNASANVNTLDDYKEGTWTPSVGGSATYITQTGYYTKIGRKVTAHCILQIASIGSGSTYLISGLPYTAADSLAGSVGHWTSAAATLAFAGCYATGTTINMTGYQGTSSLSATPGFFGNGTYVTLTVSYIV